MMRMSESSVCLVTVSTGNNTEQLFTCISSFSSLQKRASFELEWEELSPLRFYLLPYL